MCFLFLAFGTFAVSGQQPTPTPNAEPPISNVTVSFKDYQESLKNEREILQRQSDNYYARIDTLLARALYIAGGLIALAVAIFGFFFGKTYRELDELIRDEFQRKGRKWIDQQLGEIRATVEQQAQELAAIRGRHKRLSWVFSGEKNTATREFSALKLEGYKGLNEVFSSANLTENLNKSDLVIYSYDGSAAGRTMLSTIVQTIGNFSRPISLLIYTRCDGKEVGQLGDREHAILNGFLWYQPVNFPSTLIANVKILAQAA